MKPKLANWAHRYQTALRRYLRQGRHANLATARGFGSQALADGLQTLDLAKVHEATLVMHVLPAYPPRRHGALIKQAGVFFAAAVTPIEETHHSVQRTASELGLFVAALSQRTVELAASNLKLTAEVAQRKSAEKALLKSERHYSRLLAQSDLLQEQLRLLSRQILSAQEDERRKISRELHDVIAQTLTGINVRLAALKTEAAVNTKGLDRNIARTQKLVERSVDIVHQFARELRPTVLDDLGLIPALHSFVKVFSKRTRLHVRLTAFAGVEKLDCAKRTVLYRVAQEALTNVDRHARASRVEVSIKKLPDAVGLTVNDDGKAFQVKRAMDAKLTKRLGLLGMRERVEMVGGRFTVESTPGQGTTIHAEIPLGNGSVRGGGGGGRKTRQ